MRQAVVVAAVLALVAAAPRGVWARATTVTMAVAAAQRLDGSTGQTLLPGVPVAGALSVRSNIPWVLWVEVTGAGTAAWRPGGASGWTPLPVRGAVRSGPRGVHALSYELLASGPVTVRFTVAPVP